MADQPAQKTSGNGKEERRFAIQKIYIKDLSFEAPNSPKVFREEWKPDINVQLSNTMVAVEPNFYEVTISLTVTAKLGDNTAYLIEVQQAGIFHLLGFSEQEMGPMLGSYCPTVLFPYVRETISSVVERGGFPQLLLDPINFDAIYAQHVQQQQQQQAQAAQQKKADSPEAGQDIH